MVEGMTIVENSLYPLCTAIYHLSTWNPKHDNCHNCFWVTDSWIFELQTMKIVFLCV
jgi:hypothetical protein